ncbi:MAG: pirin family protein [Ignavibacteriae bacterium]|nr:pirin family protein [Ignavibacteriota bacterium]MCB9208250.1 pirin family protein [Ignavibacteriales bacterium]MCB9259012.1 pirin family protein [Ignavibacteriales bacterium]
MNKIYHPESERGFADHEWLVARHSFSFAGWYSPEKVHFGKLRVLNDDIVQPGQGFGTHPHDNMEIVTIPLKGSLAHKDSMGHEEIIKTNEVQVMSAGTGILHSEFNPSNTDLVNLLQIWVFPDKKGHTPRYNQKFFDPIKRKNKFQTIVSPSKDDGSLWLNQNAYFSLCDLDKNNSVSYKIHSKGNGLYIFNIEGKINIDEQDLNRRDALGIWEVEKVEISAEETSFFLIIEVPMN